KRYRGRCAGDVDVLTDQWFENAMTKMFWAEREFGERCCRVGKNNEELSVDAPVLSALDESRQDTRHRFSTVHDALDHVMEDSLPSSSKEPVGAESHHENLRSIGAMGVAQPLRDKHRCLPLLAKMPPQEETYG